MSSTDPSASVARASALTSRLSRQNLDALAADLAACHVLDVGVQDAGPGTAEAALALRVAGGASAVMDALGTGDLVEVLSLRGAPHLHRRADVNTLQAALVPASLGDLEATTGPLPRAVRERNDPVADVACALDEAMAEHDSMSKSELSTATTPLLDAELAPMCVPCGTHHAIDGLFRLATLRAGLHLVPQGRTQTFARLAGDGKTRFTVPADEATSARRALLEHATQVSWPVDTSQVAAWLGWQASTVRAALADAPSAGGKPSENARSARLLPARDAWLRGSDRSWLLGGQVSRRNEVFRSLGAPGVVLLGGEIVGTWRQRTAGSRTLRVEVDAWTRLTRVQRDELEQDAAIAAATRDRRPDVRWT